MLIYIKGKQKIAHRPNLTKPAFVNKVFLEDSHIRLFTYDCFPATTTELNNCNREHTAHKA